MVHFEDSWHFALHNDQNDSLKDFRDLFFIPKHNGQEVAYFCGNSLGLQPKSIRQALEVELTDWQNLGVEGHFKAKNAWLYYHKLFSESLANLVGAKPIEVVAMNSLTVNLHLLLVSFYRPDQKKYKILMEGGAFPSDQYVAESQVRFHGFDPKEAIVEIFPRKGEHTLSTEDILQVIENEKDSLALVLFGGVNYYTGQFFDLKKITEKAHAVGAKAGFDLAHAVGNVELFLHDWDVDFAAWCGYKYLNSGAGGTSGIFVHEKYAQNPDLQRFAGWWGHNESERFLMKKGFQAMQGAAGWQLSNAQVFPMAMHKAALEIFEQAGGVKILRQKSIELTAYLEFLVKKFNDLQSKIHIQILTPSQSEQRGCQLSLVVKPNGKELFDFLTENGIVTDWREPDVIRLAPVPLYNTFADIFRFYEALERFVNR